MSDEIIELSGIGSIREVVTPVAYDGHSVGRVIRHGRGEITSHLGQFEAFSDFFRGFQAFDPAELLGDEAALVKAVQRADRLVSRASALSSAWREDLLAMFRQADNFPALAAEIKNSLQTKTVTQTDFDNAKRVNRAIDAGRLEKLVSDIEAGRVGEAKVIVKERIVEVTRENTLKLVGIGLAGAAGLGGILWLAGAFG